MTPQIEGSHSGPEATARPGIHCNLARLKLWMKCPLAYRLRYIDGVQTPTSPGLFLAKLVHRGLGVFYRHRQYEIALAADDVVAWLRNAWQQLAAEESLVLASVAEEKTLRRQAEALVSAYLEQLAGDDLLPLAVEAEMHAPLVDPRDDEPMGVVLVGIVDLVLAGEAGPRVVDFKTAARRQPPLEVANELELAASAHLVRQFFSQKEEALEIRSLVKTKTPQIQVHCYPPRTPRHFSRLLCAVRAFREDIAKGRFVIRPHLGCGQCEYRDSHCAKWAG